MKSNILNIKMESLQERWMQKADIDYRIFREAKNYAVEKVRQNLKLFTYAFPYMVAVDGKYKPCANDSWTNGFWSGSIWTAYALTGDKTFFDAGKIHSILYRERVDTDTHMQTHDVGFLYSLSAVADYKLTGSSEARETAIRAAYRLAQLYRPVPGIIQRCGDFNDPEDPFTGVFIVDGMNNVPLLFWAYEQTGDTFLYEVAYQHMKNSVKVMIKDGGRIVQHGIADVETGSIISDSSQSQGKGGDDAAWGRGQAWAISGLPLSYDYTGDETFLEAAKAVIFYFLNRMPSDLVANWDLYYTDDETQRDTSASAIAVCGMLELCDHLPDDDRDKEVIKNAALRIMESLTKKYLTKGEDENMGVLNAATYGFGWKGTDEPNLFGDYYYMEALNRILGNYRRFW